ncbi:calcium-binding protein [Acuticoccus kandeliae]|uniref:calcium-binding protein n=1 Tax=Acuticoccus kandeliae TaxID=2073160 RepID=UPI001300A23B|nr:calcium-binding protein [Acuticoccus kandeliae]
MTTLSGHFGPGPVTIRDDLLVRAGTTLEVTGPGAYYEYYPTTGEIDFDWAGDYTPSIILELLNANIVIEGTVNFVGEDYPSINGFYFKGAGEHRFVNRGTISSTDPNAGAVIDFADRSTGFLRNEGTITGFVLMGNNADLVANQRTIEGSLYTLGGDDRVFARGAITETHLGRGDDFYSGTRGREGTKVFGDEGDDWIKGTRYDDHLSGGDGNDKLYANNGDDTLSGDGGNDVLIGWNGAEEFRIGDGRDAIVNFQPEYGDRIAIEGVAFEDLSFVQAGLHTSILLDGEVIAILAEYLKPLSDDMFVS